MGSASEANPLAQNVLLYLSDRSAAAAPPPPPPPPSAAAVSSLLSPHVLSEDKQRCLKCFSSATKACMKAWWPTPCPQLYNVNGIIMSPKRGDRIHIMGDWAHPTHTLNVHMTLRIWLCTQCGGIAEKQNRLLSKPCREQMNKTQREYLDRLAAGLKAKGPQPGREKGQEVEHTLMG